MEAGDWSNPGARAVIVAVGDGALLGNAWWEPLAFRLPAAGPWSLELDTADPGTRPAAHRAQSHEPRDAQSPPAMAGCQRNSWLISTTFPSGSVV
jgi:hypothetical protein